MAVGWGPTDVSKAFKDRNLLQCDKLRKKNLFKKRIFLNGLRGIGLVPYKKEQSATVLT